MAIFTGALCFAQNAELPRLAVVKFTGDATERDARRVRDMVESVMIDSGNYTIVSTDDIDLILEQQQIALSSIGSADNITKLERENIQYIVTGTVNREGAESFVSLRMLDVKNARFIPNSPRGVVNMTSMSTIYQGVGAIAAAFLASGGRVYKIGDFGPAGGIVFYDKGNNTGGWRYLEVAPQDLGEVEWGLDPTPPYVEKPYVYPENTLRHGEEIYNNITAFLNHIETSNKLMKPDVGGTSTAIGNGKNNTLLILDALNKEKITGRAAQLCSLCAYGGYNDWFLPSKDELDLMYKNLKLKGLGNFSSGFYWSSSQSNSDKSYCAWGQSFSDGKQSNGRKDGKSYVRAIRAF